MTATAAGGTVTVNIPGGGGGTSTSYRKVVLQNGSAFCRLNLIGYGSQADLDAVSINQTGGNVIAFTNVAASLKIQTLSISYDAGFNTSTSFAITYPEPFGETDARDMIIPLVFMFNEATPSVMQATSNCNYKNTSGTVEVTKTGLVASTAYRWRYVLF